MRLTKPLVLASQSPRRIQLLRQIGLRPDVIPSNVIEEFDPGISPEENASVLARKKAIDVGKTVDDAIVIGADTIVVLENAYLGKPRDQTDAIRMLQMLSGRTHIVFTAFSLLDRPSNRSRTEVESTAVTFRELPLREVEEYVATGAPMDKAGAYGIQDDYGAVFVTHLEGCYYNVVGFPLAKFFMTFQEFQSELVQQ
jgi:septum formation protein